VNEFADPFDENIELWAMDPLSAEGLHKLLEVNAMLAPQALSCGYLGIVMAAGMIKKH
jgi:hypothetical protein